ncbi:hypothetical protein G8768_20685 [Pseudoteredinibacter isoporae]|uniref:DUF2232 domain-containing protein n=2 Tax=Pseudoteredinibacter isoporae TaxID=570281 RepID=A0A7X0MZ74_9GAMM|nr:hypothetical protein [Pseudoteredinibacter isoporae]MBB6523864.1 hypothetical protein [Pseudoteredinibacter isoporae]NHO89381.1 hypothetical protein [Pseudoteredinibacter isoporae]NIB22488.1 hypothetical protein [Pseudoteredinibacter isoporae]
MRALAEFIMRGRLQASVAALIGSWFPLISPATVALVTLRRGASDGTVILLVAMLPALLALFASDLGPLMSLVTMLSLLLVFGVALILRRSISWAAAIMAMVALSSAASLLLGQVVPAPVESLVEVLGDLFKEIQAQAPEGEPQAQLPVPGERFALGLIAYVLALSSIASLILARWWQSMLYNPGGFGEEFRQLRLNRSSVIISFVAALYCFSQGSDYAIWASLFGFPLLLQGIAIVHFVVKQRQMGVQWLVLMYLALLFASPVALVLTLLAVLDSWIDFRGRLSQSS